MEEKIPYLAIIDYGCGNVKSILNISKSVGCKAIITRDADEILNSSGIIFPGVGSFDNGITKVRKNGLDKVLEEAVFGKKIYFFGICLGMQLLFNSSEEGVENGLGWIDGVVKKFNPEESADLRVPHMGWNKINIVHDSALLNGLDAESRFYFVHSFFCKSARRSNVISETKHGSYFNSIVNKDNIYGMQFHPEKSHKYGKIIFQNIKKLITKDAY
tara:strand:+ start:3921 stop:4568 length:648 start_codon:yes stop_codon:yes gene_type:complete